MCHLKCRAIVILLMSGWLMACTTVRENRNPITEKFPTVAGKSLSGAGVTLPDYLEGAPAVILVGYTQEAQFDIDRWLMGLLQAGVKHQIIEVPTIPGLVPSMASKWIDKGMRSGIPKEDWAAVVTLYGRSARPVTDFTGNENGRLARVLVLNSKGEVVWFDDKGYSVKKAFEAAKRIGSL